MSNKSEDVWRNVLLFKKECIPTIEKHFVLIIFRGKEFLLLKIPFHTWTARFERWRYKNIVPTIQYNVYLLASGLRCSLSDSGLRCLWSFKEKLLLFNNVGVWGMAEDIIYFSADHKAVRTLIVKYLWKQWAPFIIKQSS